MRRGSRVVAVTVWLLALLAAGCAASGGTADVAAPRPTPGSEPPGAAGSVPEATTTTTVPPTTLPAPAAPALPSPGDNRVYVLGDSVILGAQYDVPRDLVGWKVTFDAQESRLVNHGIDVLRAAKKRVDDLRTLARADLEQAYADAGRPPPPAEPPLSTLDALGHVFVISLCTNYLAGGGFDRFIEQYMTYLAGAARVVWVTCAEWSPGQVEANAAIRAAASANPAAVACDWAMYSSTAGYTYEDGIHLTEMGRAVMGDLVARCVGPAPEPLPPAPTTTRPRPTSTTTTATTTTSTIPALPAPTPEATAPATP